MTRWFVWDAFKARINARKHGVTFETARLVFDDPLALFEQDRIDGGEYRWRAIGSANGVAVLLVAHTHVDHEDGDETIRLISARPATAAERRLYEQQRHGDR
jgi:uncharacterized DUF497 family protein